MFNPAAYENSRPDGIGALEVVNGDAPEPGQPRRFVPLKRTELKGEVAGPLASLRLIQTYGYSREQCDKVLETVYRFPLPGDAAVTHVQVCFGEVEIRAALKERQQAEAEYTEAKRQGRQAALATREAPDVFTLRVAGIHPDEDVTVETAYVQRARSEGTGWSLRIPLTTAPRYVREDESGSRHAEGPPLLLLRDPGHRFALDLTVRGAGAVESATHPLDVSATGDGLRVRLSGGAVLPERDCILSWRPAQEEQRPALHVLLHADPTAEHLYFLALVAPPARREPGQGVPREVVLLVDHSGSMEGAKWQAADWAVTRFLSGLTERDAFALGLFHNTTRWFDKTPQPAEPDTVAQAVRFLQQHRDSGGTNLGVALEQALSANRAPGERARHALIVTDAQVSDAGRILRLASEEARRGQDRRRISVLCIDAAPNDFLARELAERGGGTARFLTSSPEEGDISTALDEVLEDWAEPVLAGLRLEVSRAGVEAASREVVGRAAGWSAVDLGDLPSGRAVWVAGRAPKSEVSDLVFRVTTGDGREVTAHRPSLATEDDAGPALKALFGARRVLGLEFLISSGYALGELSEQLARLGYDPEAVPGARSGSARKVYAENQRDDASKALRGLLVQEALTYGLASSETAFVAVRTEAGKLVEGTVPVANALPSGWSERFAGAVSAGAVLYAASPPSFGMLRRASPGSFSALAASDADAMQPVYALHAAEDVPATPSLTTSPLFSGVPAFTNGAAILFDSASDPDASKVPEGVTLSRLEVRFPDGTPDPDHLDPGLSLLLYVDDLSSPRARVRLADLVRQGGARPLNVRRLPGQVVRIVLLDPAGAWARNAPPVEVFLG